MAPSLKILVHPIEKIRFRYLTEPGSHGCLKGKDTSTKSFPSVKLENYQGTLPIYIKATLYTNEKHSVKHIFELRGPNCENGVCVIKTDKEKNLIAEFNNLWILNKTKKEIKDFLDSNNNKKLTLHDFNKNANLRNSVKICFQAFQDKCLKKPLCEKIFSKPIYDSKSSSVGKLKLCRISKCSGSCKGNEEVILLCDKIKKDDIEIHFVQRDSDGNVIWQAKGMFNLVDVHHQVAIPFKTPPYQNQNIEGNVNVTIELYRKSDGERSNSLCFIYKPDEYDEIFRKTQKNNFMEEKIETSNQQIENMNILQKSNKISDFNNSSSSSNTSTNNEGFSSNNSNHSENAEYISLNYSSDFNNYEAFLPNEQNHLINSNQTTWALTQNQCNETFVNEKSNSPLWLGTDPSLSETLEYISDLEGNIPIDFDSLDLKLFSNAIPDCIDETQNEFSHLSLSSDEQKKQNEIYPKNRDNGCNKDCRLIVQKTFQGLINFIKQLISQNIYPVLNSLVSLLWTDNNEGNTFLHLALLYGGATSFIMNLIIISNITFINKPNKYKQTSLHLAILKKDEDLVHLLLKHGANPCNQDINGNNCFHLCVKKNFIAILKILLSTPKLPPDKLDVANYEGFTPLHLAVLCNSTECLQLILDENCNVNIQEIRAGQTALHLALKYQPHLVKILLKKPEIEKQIKDFLGRTPIELAFISKNPQIIMQFNEDKINKFKSHSQNPLQFQASHLCFDNVENKKIENKPLKGLKEKLSPLMDPPSEKWRKLGIYIMDDDLLKGLNNLEPNHPTSMLLDQILKENNGLNKLIEFLEDAGLNNEAKIAKEYC